MGIQHEAGAAVRAWREHRGLNMEQLAERMNAMDFPGDRWLVGRVEAGAHGTRITVYAAIADALRIEGATLPIRVARLLMGPPPPAVREIAVDFNGAGGGGVLRGFAAAPILPGNEALAVDGEGCSVGGRVISCRPARHGDRYVIELRPNWSSWRSPTT